jgi:hypothetical protein
MIGRYVGVTVVLSMIIGCSLLAARTLQIGFQTGFVETPLCALPNKDWVEEILKLKVGKLI